VSSAAMNGRTNHTSGTVDVVAAPSTIHFRLRSQPSEEDEDLTESNGDFDSIYATELASRLAAAARRSQTSDSSNEEDSYK
jgi:hypothetical protein